MTKTEKLKNIILSRYTSIREFARIVEIPSTTLTSALDKDIGGMAVDRVIKICEILELNIKDFEPLTNKIFTKKQLTENETTLLSSYNKLNNLGKREANKRVSELTEINNYICKDDINVTELITSTKEYPQTLEDIYTTVAAHDDDLTEHEKSEMDRRILEALKKRQK